MPRSEYCAKVIIEGYVQGVGYRYFAQDTARAMGIKGYVRNISQGRVEALAEGRKEDVEAFIEKLRQGPFNSDVKSVDVTFEPCKNVYEDFLITY